MEDEITTPTTCTKIKANGERCQARKLIGEEFCYFHSSQVIVSRAEARRRGGLRRHGGKGETGSYSVKSGRDVLNILEDCINDCYGLEQTQGRGKTIGYLCSIILKGFEVTEIESRLLALEEKVYGKH